MLPVLADVAAGNAAAGTAVAVDNAAGADAIGNGLAVGAVADPLAVCVVEGNAVVAGGGAGAALLHLG